MADTLDGIAQASANRDAAAKGSQDEMHDEMGVIHVTHALRIAIADAARLAGEHAQQAEHHKRLHEIHLRMYDELKRLERS